MEFMIRSVNPQMTAVFSFSSHHHRIDANENLKTKQIKKKPQPILETQLSQKFWDVSWVRKLYTNKINLIQKCSYMADKNASANISTCSSSLHLFILALSIEFVVHIA